MMKLFLLMLMFSSCYYTFTYGIALWKGENNKLAGSATMLLAVIAFILPTILLFVKG